MTKGFDKEALLIHVGIREIADNYVILIESEICVVEEVHIRYERFVCLFSTFSVPCGTRSETQHINGIWCWVSENDLGIPLSSVKNVVVSVNL
jgi:hypothetical protein